MKHLTIKRILIAWVFFLIFDSVAILILLRATQGDSPEHTIPKAESPRTLLTPTPAATLIPSSNPKASTAPFLTPSPTPTNSHSQQVLIPTRAGLYTISGFVYFDSDQDHTFDANEQGVGGAEIKVSGNISRTINTLASGFYSFTALTRGVYSVNVSAPSGYSVLTAGLTNFQIDQDRRHDIGIKPTTGISSGSSSSSATSTSTPTPQQAHYYVATTGSDSSNGSESAPYRTIQKAVNVTKTDSDPGAVIHVMAGTYREAVAINTVTGTETSPVEIKAEDGPDSVYILGSESSQDSRITWAQSDGGLSFPAGVSAHIYRADVSIWNATPELAFNNDTTITRLPKAHEPDFGVTTDWKHHENWWKADGIVGSTKDSLVDDTNDTSGTYPEADDSAGNLGSINGYTSDFLSGARLFVKDTHDGHDSLTETIATHTASSGTITLDDELEYYDGSAAIGQYSKYYVEGKPQLLDEEGEWYFDPVTEYLYIWPENDVNPNTLELEFAVRNTAVNIRNSAYVRLKDLNLQFTNYAYSGVTGPDGAVRFFGFTNDITNNITLDGLAIRHNGVGLRLYQSNAATDSPGTLSYVTVENSTIEYSDSYGMMVWHFPLSGPTPFIHNLWLENNEFGHMGFRGSGVGLFMQHPEKIVAINNYFHHSAHNNFDIQQGKASGDSYVYIANNLFEASCYNGIDCGAMKILNSDGGTGSNTILVTHNIMRGTKGWAYASEAQSDSNSPFGYGYTGFGYYSDVVEAQDPADGCAIGVFRNLIYNNSAGGIHFTRSRDQCAFNNVLAQNGVGIHMNNYGVTVDGSFNNILRGNIIQHTESGNATNANIYGIVGRINKSDEDELEVDLNKYQMSGAHAFDMYKQDISFTNVGTFTTVTDIRANTPWEDSGSDVTGGSIGITTEQSYDISAIESSFGVGSVTVPTELQDIISNLSDYYDITITNGVTVGRNP